AEDLLVSPDQECRQVVGLAVEGVQRQGAADVAAVDELVHLAVAVARDVAQHGAAGQRLVQAVNRHDGEKLLHRPAIGHALEQREVAEVGVGEHPVEALELFGEHIQLERQGQDLTADQPVQVLGQRALFEGQVAQRKQVQGRIERLLGVVETFQQVLGSEVLVGFQEVDQRLFDVVRQRGGHLLVAIASHAQDVEHQNAVIGGDGAAALGDDGRVRDLALIADVLDVIDDVVGVLLERVVDAGFEIGLRAVVIDAQAAADVEEFEAAAALLEIDVDAGGFDDRGLDVADVGDLTAEMEVQQLEAILQARGLECFEGADGLCDREAEFRAVPAGGFPAAGAAAGKLDADADLGPHADLLGVFEDQVELGVLFNDEDDAAADLAGQHHHLDVLVVLEAVADDRGLVVGDGHDGQQFGLGADLEAEAVLAAVFVDLLDDVALLVDLDGIDAAVSALVVVLGDRGLKGSLQLLKLVAEDFPEADQDGRVDAAQDQGIDQLLEVDGAVGVAAGMHQHVAFFADREIALAPARDVEGLTGLGDAPALHGLEGCTGVGDFQDQGWLQPSCTPSVNKNSWQGNSFCVPGV